MAENRPFWQIFDSPRRGLIYSLGVPTGQNQIRYRTDRIAGRSRHDASQRVRESGGRLDRAAGKADTRELGIHHGTLPHQTRGVRPRCTIGWAIASVIPMLASFALLYPAACPGWGVLQTIRHRDPRLIASRPRQLRAANRHYFRRAVQRLRPDGVCRAVAHAGGVANRNDLGG